MQPVTNEQIDLLLDQHRPDRYDVDDHTWRAPVVAVVAQQMPIRQAQQVAAERLVGDREGRATRSVNSLMRRVARERQWPLPDLADDLMRRPMSIGAERVCLGAAQARDFEQWAIDERRDAAQDFSARSEACDGAEWIAREMSSNGWTLFADAYAPKRGAA